MASNSTTPESRHDGESGVEEIMASQIAYYRAHAPRYDDWWVREGRHDLGEVFRSKWQSEILTVRAALTAEAPFGDVLEFAGGTGNWTVELAKRVNSVTVVDASPEAVAIASQKVVGDKVTWLVKDIFSYRPNRRYKTVFFSFGSATFQRRSSISSGHWLLSAWHPRDGSSSSTMPTRPWHGTRCRSCRLTGKLNPQTHRLPRSTASLI